VRFYVAQVSVRGVYLRSKVFVKRQTPESIVLGLPGDMKLLPKRLGSLHDKVRILYQIAMRYETYREHPGEDFA